MRSSARSGFCVSLAALLSSVARVSAMKNSQTPRYRLLRSMTCVLLLSSGMATAQSYTYQTAAMVGYVQVSGGRAGVAVWTQKDGTTFPHCTAQPTHMWVDTVGVSEESAKSTLAVLLTAKTTDQSVMVYYSVDATGHCKMGHVAIN